MKLKDYREAIGIGFTTAAEELGVSESQLSRYESGLSIPRQTVMLRIKKWSKECVQPNDFYYVGGCVSDNKL